MKADVDHSRPGPGTRWCGREAIVASYPKVLAGYTERVDRPVRYLRDGSAVVVEVAFTGRTTAGRWLRRSA